MIGNGPVENLPEPDTFVNKKTLVFVVLNWDQIVLIVI